MLLWFLGMAMMLYNGKSYCITGTVLLKIANTPHNLMAWGPQRVSGTAVMRSPSTQAQA
jgi:hypothetical protein